MIYIEKDQIIPENENIRVFSPTGDYNDSDPIEYYSIEDPSIAQGSFHAQFIKYGGLVYRFSDPKELGAEILKIDPESTHGAASYVRMTNELLHKLNDGELQSDSLQQTIDVEQQSVDDRLNDEANLGTQDIQEKIDETQKNIDQLDNDSSTASSTTPTNIPTDTNTSTTTPKTETPPPIIESPAGQSTTTAPILEDEPILVPELPAQPIEVPVEIPVIEEVLIEEPLGIIKSKRKLT